MNSLLLSLIFPLLLFLQGGGPLSGNKATIPQEPVYLDTLHGIVTDGFTVDFGTVKALPPRFIKEFKYVGKKPVVITRSWTSDPHFICDYPKEPLMPGKTYSFTVCFVNRCGPLNKTMGIDLSDGSTIPFRFKGSVPCPE